MLLALYGALQRANKGAMLLALTSGLSGTVIYLVTNQAFGMLALSTSYGRQTELIMAATVMNIVPLIVIFVAFQKHLVKGLQLGGLKG